ncbi:MAG: formimidoylglutamate deiminase [Pseudolabrys sp.]|jgi:formiminoglutamate deiminase
MRQSLVHALIFDDALLPEGWAKNVRVEIDGGVIAAVTPEASADGAERVAGIALPGLANLHCHAFQRGMAGLAERRGPAHDSFWTWREVMYRFLDRLTPDDAEAIATFAYMEMLERGFTAVGEFHYLHHDRDGAPYADIGEMATRIAAASQATGIGLTLLPVFYAYGGFGGAAPVAGQRRFLNAPDRFAKLLSRSRDIISNVPRANIGIAPHSLRAVTPETLREAVAAARQGPIHIHAAEQTREVDDCVAWSGQRPIEWLLANMPVDQRWCVIHATHMTADETKRLAGIGAVAGLCPLTESSLGDGIFNGTGWLEADGRYGVGTDSNIDIDAPGELRQLEYSQRLGLRGRNLMTTAEGESSGRRLYSDALAGGAQALNRPMGALAPGMSADIVVLDAEHPDLAGRSGDLTLDAYIFVAGRGAVRDVYAGGERVVTLGRHRLHDELTARYRAVLSRLVS